MVSCSTTVPLYQNDAGLTPEKLKELDNNLGSVEIYNNFLNSLDKIITDNGVEEIYPDYYGGSYTNDEGTCVFLIASGKDLDAAKRDLAKRGKSINFRTQWSEHSYVELIEVLKFVKSKLFDPAFDEKREELKWYGLYIDSIRSRIIVRLGELTEEYITKFKMEVSDSPLIDFEEGFPNIINARDE